jgi:WhiB family redox-sensing transcriptional regulator
MNELQRTYASVTKAMSWMNKANCKNMDVNIFFPELAATYDPFIREVCNSCPVIEKCLWYANETRADTGMFAAMSPSERQNWRRKNNVQLGMSKEDWDNRFRNRLRTPANEWSNT